MRVRTPGYGPVFYVPWRTMSKLYETELVLGVDLPAAWPLGGNAELRFQLDSSSLTLIIGSAGGDRLKPRLVRLPSLVS
jgi:hypothetical protein